jgi:hypothetical protein
MNYKTGTLLVVTKKTLGYLTRQYNHDFEIKENAVVIFIEFFCEHDIQSMKIYMNGKIINENATAVDYYKVLYDQV